MKKVVRKREKKGESSRSFKLLKSRRKKKEEISVVFSRLMKSVI